MASSQATYSTAEPLGELITLVYPTLCRMAAAKAHVRGMTPSDLTHETVCRLLKLPDPPTTEPQIEGVAWQMMDWVLTDRVRAEAARHQRERGEATPMVQSPRAPDPRLRQIRLGVSHLSKLDPRKAEALMLSAVGGLPMERIAEMLGVSPKTVQRDLEFARSWVASYFREFPDGEPSGVIDTSSDVKRSP